jgi:hypothetical protein
MPCRFRVRIRTNPNNNPDPALLAQIVISFGRCLKQQRQHQNFRDTATDGSQDGPQ